jgi:murein DD-endopeptidase MepM/ murein hydrolase activator NlpD
VPSNVVGEAIILMSQVFDMDAFADSADRLELLYGAEGGADADSAGQVLYIALRGTGRSFECYVARPAPDQPYACFAPNLPGGKSGGTGGGGNLAAGMSLPVPQGTLTSTFGPRLHPKLGVVRMHKGVDWAAPVGTPVLAALSGTVKSLAKSDSYGNLIILDHGSGTETHYAHLDGFAPGLADGQTVQAGQQIGQLGNTGLSTGPHLHFELYRNGEAVDPLGAGGTHLAGDEAVDLLTDRIIAVESGGKADAKNPLSSATGLGQFISSTWLRMMRTYRPDLVSTLSQEALLALRTDPTVSREMVRNLAREGEAYLRARGHDITAGRLYLCHFLGMEGAHVLLSADPATAAVDVLGPDVERANPTIITGRTAAQVIDWAEGKMSGHGAGPAAPPPQPPEVAAYRDMIVALVGSPT